jgi:hypothetical protein
MQSFAAFDHSIIWGVGETEEAARDDATVWVGHGHRGHILHSIDDLQVAPMTLRLQVAVNEHGINKRFVLRDDGQLDLAKRN